MPIKHAEEVEEVFDAISYSKGACVIRMINAVLGEEAFRKGLQTYMKVKCWGLQAGIACECCSFHPLTSRFSSSLSATNTTTPRPAICGKLGRRPLASPLCTYIVTSQLNLRACFSGKLLLLFLFSTLFRAVPTPHLLF